jgi:uncharacterized membrane protein
MKWYLLGYLSVILAVILCSAYIPMLSAKRLTVGLILLFFVIVGIVINKAKK